MALSQEKSGAAKTAQLSEPRCSFNEEPNWVAFDNDLAAAIVPNRAQEFDIATEHRVRRKIDWYLIPWMWLGYGFVYYDKVR